MPTRWGQIVGWGRTGSKFAEAYLDSGQKVELPLPALDDLSGYPPRTTLVFVERRGRLFGYVQWVGTPAEAIAAVQDGTLDPREVPPAVQALANVERRWLEMTPEVALEAARIVWAAHGCDLLEIRDGQFWIEVKGPGGYVLKHRAPGESRWSLGTGESLWSLEEVIRGAQAIEMGTADRSAVSGPLRGLPEGLRDKVKGFFGR